MYQVNHGIDCLQYLQRLCFVTETLSFLTSSISVLTAMLFELDSDAIKRRSTLPAVHNCLRKLVVRHHVVDKGYSHR